MRWLVTLLLASELTSCGSSAVPVTLERATAPVILQKVAEHKGREAVLVNFWATWCAPCVEEFPMIVDLGRSRRGEGLIVYFVSVDWLDQTEQVAAFLERHGVEGLNFIKDEKDNPFINGISGEWTGAAPGLAVPGTGLSACSWPLLSQRRPINRTWRRGKIRRDFRERYLLYSSWRI